MSSAYFAPLVPLPVLITEPGYYETRRGEKVLVIKVSAKHDFKCVGYYLNPQGRKEIKERWHKSGRLFANQLSKNDIVKRLEDDS